MVTFDANGGTPIPAPQMVPYGGLVARPVDPTRVGYVFSGWYPVVGFSSAAWDFNTDMVFSNMTLVAQWTQVYLQVAFDANGGTPTPAVQTVPYGGLVSEPAAPVREGYVFAGWYPAADFSGYPWYFATDAVTMNMTLYARWQAPAYQVTFNANDGVPTPPAQTVPYGSLVAEPADPVRVGYAFEGWYPTADFSGSPWNFAYNTVTGNMTLYARWTPLTFVVTFDTNGGVPVPAPQTVAYGATVSRPTDPTREGYAFIAWYSTPNFSSDPWIFSANTVTSNLTLYARWLEPA